MLEGFVYASCGGASACEAGIRPAVSNASWATHRFLQTGHVLRPPPSTCCLNQVLRCSVWNTWKHVVTDAVMGVIFSREMEHVSLLWQASSAMSQAMRRGIGSSFIEATVTVGVVTAARTVHSLLSTRYAAGAAMTSLSVYSFLIRFGGPACRLLQWE